MKSSRYLLSSPSEVYEKAVKPLVKGLIRGVNSTWVIASPLKQRNNSLLFRLNPHGYMMSVYETASKLINVLKKGGRFPNKEFILRVKGFNVLGPHKVDIFTANPFDSSSQKAKSLKLESAEDMSEFCKIARHSLSVLKAATNSNSTDKEAIQCVQLHFEIRDGQ